MSVFLSLFANTGQLNLEEAAQPVIAFWKPAQDYFDLLGQWFIDQRINLVLFAVMLVAAFVLASVFTWVFRNAVQKLVHKGGFVVLDDMLEQISRPLYSLLLASGMICAIAFLKLPEQFDSALQKIYYTIATLCIVWGMIRVMTVLRDYFRAKALKTNTSFDNLLIDLVYRVTKAAVWIIAVLFIAQNVFALNVSAMLAGAGVAGLAVAFAAQNTIANIFGAISLILDKPFKVGDRIIAAGKDGIVEGIGLRSTRLRSLDGTLWFIPNREMADASIENMSRRPNFKSVMSIGLVYSTPPEKMTRAGEILHEILDRNPMFDLDKLPPRIYFTDMKDWSLNITVIVWFQTTDYFTFLAEKEKVNVEILKRFNDEGLEFAFPSNTTYVAGDRQRPLLVQSPTASATDGQPA